MCTKQLHITNALDYFNYDGVLGNDLALALFQSPPNKCIKVCKQVITLKHEIREKLNIGIFVMRKMVPSSVIGERTWHIR